MNYFAAQTFLKGKEQRTVPSIRATVMRRLGPNYEDGIALRYQSTDVVTFYPDYCVLQTGGWQTSTTKNRMNAYLPKGVRAYQDKSIFYVHAYADDSWNWADGTNSLYYDGMRISYDGTVLDPRDPTEKEKEVRALKRSVAKYLKGFATALAEGMEYPNGDCFLCRFDVEGIDHLLSHIEESYYVGKLAINAVQEAKYSSPAFILGLKDGQIKPPFTDLVVRSIRKYLYRRLL